MSTKNKKDLKGLGENIPPDPFLVNLYFEANGSTIDFAQRFYNYYKHKGWLNQCHKRIRNWKVIAWQWIYYGPKIC